MGINKCIFIGNVGKDPETKTVGGAVVAKFSIAVTEKFKDKSGDFQERTEWVSIEAWGKTAEFVGKYVTKGRTVYVEGQLRTDVSGEGVSKRYYTKVRAQSVMLIGPRPESAEEEL